MPYNDIINMPVQRFYNLLRWKTKLEEEKKQKFDEEVNKIKTKNARALNKKGRR